jgi:non-specific serine/threonine protein kinase
MSQLDEIQSVRLIPAGALHFTGLVVDYRNTLFDLGAQNYDSEAADIRYWRNFSELFIKALCRHPDDVGIVILPYPSPSKLETMVQIAPPMIGGEYLSPLFLKEIWSVLAAWCASQAKAGIGDFLKKMTPLRKRVGRIALELTENEDNPSAPFSLTANYAPSMTKKDLNNPFPLTRALKQFSDKNDKEALQNIIDSMKDAKERLPWFTDLVEKGSAFGPRHLTQEQAYTILNDEPVMFECGVTCSFPERWINKKKVTASVTIGDEKTQNLNGETIYNWDVGISVDGVPQSDNDILKIKQILDESGGSVIFFRWYWIEVDKEELYETIEKWNLAKEVSGETGITFTQALRLLSGVPILEEMKEAFPIPNQWVRFEAGNRLHEILIGLKDIQDVNPPQGLQCNLSPFQKKGLSWLNHLTDMGLGGCLADDMGVGKTMQILALLLRKKQDHEDYPPSLLIVPASIIAHWKEEAEKYAPSLRLKIFHSSQSLVRTINEWRKKPDDLLQDCDLVVTSFGMLTNNLSFFKNINWQILIIDDAHAIREPGTVLTKDVKELQAKSRIALTGVPIDNIMSDLWSIFDFLIPGILGSLEEFLEVVDKLLKKDGAGFAPIRKLISPFILRRLKKEPLIARYLPEKIQSFCHCYLSADQAKLYAETTATFAEGLKDCKGPRKDYKLKEILLQTLPRLKRILCHPDLVTGDMNWDCKKSGKFMRLRELCSEMAEHQEKCTIFVQFVEIIPPLFDFLTKVFGRPGICIFGEKPLDKRMQKMATFEEDNGPPFLILPLSAAVRGFRPKQPRHVIFFDRWWNPTVEDLVSNKFIRFFINRSVEFHKFSTKGTIEERVDDILRDKDNLSNYIQSANDKNELDFSKLKSNDLIQLVRLELVRDVL